MHYLVVLLNTPIVTPLYPPFFHARDHTQDLPHARQVLYHRAISPAAKGLKMKQEGKSLGVEEAQCFRGLCEETHWKLILMVFNMRM